MYQTTLTSQPASTGLDIIGCQVALSRHRRRTPLSSIRNKNRTLLSMDTSGHAPADFRLRSRSTTGAGRLICCARLRLAQAYRGARRVSLSRDVAAKLLHHLALTSKLGQGSIDLSRRFKPKVDEEHILPWHPRNRTRFDLGQVDAGPGK